MATWPSGQRSLVDQVCLDITPDGYDVEAAFWAELTGWERRAGARPEFEYLVRPHGIPLRLLLQRLDDARQPACGAHLDLACDEVSRHLDLGASVERRTADWVTLRDPAGLAYCITRRDPGTGRLA
jgi:Glyoxalase-like domain